MPDAPDNPFIPAVHALHLAGVASRFGVEDGLLFEGTNLDASALAEPNARLPIATMQKLVDRARELTGEPGLGFYLGLQMRVSAHGYLGFAAMTSATARHALQVAIRFAPTRTNALALRLHEAGDMAALVIEEKAEFGSARDVLMLALMVGIQQIGSALTGKALNGTADVAFPRPEYVGRFEHLVSGRMRFGQPQNQLVFERSVLDLRFDMADPVAARLARDQCERELEALGSVELPEARVKALLVGADGEFRTVDDVAAELHVSARTLKRRLAEQGTDFSTLLDAERRDRALLLLRAPDLSLDEVAARVGYSDVANFTRAFKRWTGSTPAAFRRGLR